MKVKIEGATKFLEEISNEMSLADESHDQNLKTSSDNTELKFSIEEVSQLVGIVSGCVQLAQVIWNASKRRRTKRNLIEVKTALGSAKITLDESTSLEDVIKLLTPFFPKE